MTDLIDTSRDPVARVGDRIRFSAATRCGPPVATRKVKRLGDHGSYEVGFHGWPNFIVHKHEVLTIYRDAEEIHVRETVR